MALYRIDILTLFPEMFAPVLDASIMGKARRRGALRLGVHNIRRFAEGKHRITDDEPFGGGSGMVMKPEPIIRAALAAWRRDLKPYTVLMTPQGEPLTDEIVKDLEAIGGEEKGQLIVVCGRYEGVDERIRDLIIDREISLGDFVLTGGEIPAMALVDAVSRRIPGVLGNEDSLSEESFSEDLLEYPQYTRPRQYLERDVPEVLVSGDHKRIKRWRREKSLERTFERRPDLLARAEARGRLTADDKIVVERIGKNL